MYAGMVTFNAAESAMTSSRGTQPRRLITQPWPEIKPPEGSTYAVSTPLALVTGMCSLSARSAVLVRSSGWNRLASA